MKKLKEKLNAKLSKNGGFTLVEMLIVVAIIAILVAVSMPLVGSALEEARKATDAANERGFKSALVSGYLLEQANMAEAGSKVVAKQEYFYDAVNGKVSSSTSLSAYGKSSGLTTFVLIGRVSDTGEVTMGWMAPSTPLKADGSTSISDNLVSPDLIAPTP